MLTQSMRHRSQHYLDDSSKANGIIVGHQAASATLIKRAKDVRDATVIYSPGSGLGVWVRTGLITNREERMVGRAAGRFCANIDVCLRKKTKTLISKKKRQPY
jgi:hypothetical protein